MSKQLPRAVSESTLTIGAATLRVSQLDNGTRVIDADDVERFFAGGGTADQLVDAWQTDTERALARVTAERDRLREACVNMLSRIEQLQDQWGKEGFTDGTARMIREALKATT